MCRDEAVEPGAGDVGGGDAVVANGLVRVGGPEHVLPCAPAGEQHAEVEGEGDRQRPPADLGEVVAERLYRVGEAVPASAQVQGEGRAHQTAECASITPKPEASSISSSEPVKVPNRWR